MLCEDLRLAADAHERKNILGGEKQNNVLDGETVKDGPAIEKGVLNGVEIGSV